MVSSDERQGESPFGQYLGLRLVEIDDEHAVAEIAIQPHHLNPTGMIHGGVLIAMADNVATAMANRAREAIEDDGKFMIGIDLHASMLANQPGGSIRAEARIVRAGRRVTFVRTVVTGDSGRTLAEVSTTHIPA